MDHYSDIKITGNIDDFQPTRGNSLKLESSSTTHRSDRREKSNSQARPANFSLSHLIFPLKAALGIYISVGEEADGWGEKAISNTSARARARLWEGYRRQKELNLFLT